MIKALAKNNIELYTGPVSNLVSFLEEYKGKEISRTRPVIVPVSSI